MRACVWAGERADERAGERLGERAGGWPGERLGGQAETGGRLGERAGGWARAVKRTGRVIAQSPNNHPAKVWKCYVLAGVRGRDLG